MEYTLNYSLIRQDKLAQEEGYTGVRREGEVNNWAQVGHFREKE